MYNMYVCDNVVHNLQVLGICRPTCNCMARTGPVGGSLATLQVLPEVQVVSLRQVKAWKEEKGFGFLVADDGTEVCKAQGNSGYR